MNDIRYATGRVTLMPATPVQVNQQGRWTLVFTAGEGGWDAGTTMYISMPQGFTAPQIDNPLSPGFVQITEKTTQADVSVAVGRVPGETKEDVNADMGIYLFVERAQIKNNETFHLVYGAGDGQAFAPSFAGLASFPVWICVDGRALPDRFLPVKNAPVLPTVARDLGQLEVLAPSGGQAGMPLTMRVIGRDVLGNRCVGWRGWFRMESDVQGVLIPASQRNEDTTGEGALLDVGFSDRLTGVVRLRVRESDSGVVGRSNPILMGEPTPFWGDLHACLPEDVSAHPDLDFILNVGTVPTLQKASFHFQTDSVEGALTTPSSGFLRFSLPDAHSDEMLPSHLLEIYSCWGNREHWGGQRPDIRLDRHPDRTAQGVLAQGIIAGFAAGSNSRFGVGRDARRAEAGRGYPAGMTAVYADSLDQKDLFFALRERSCYATTGARILLQVLINEHPMGQLVEVSADEEKIMRERRIVARVYGTAPIERIEVIRNNVEICTYRGDGEDVKFEWVDQQSLTRIALPRNLRGGGLTCYYYVRVTQKDGEMAWSSPIWFMLKR